MHALSLLFNSVDPTFTWAEHLEKYIDIRVRVNLFALYILCLKAPHNSYPNSVPAKTSSSPSSYDYVPPPRQASEPNIPVESVYGAINRPQSLNIQYSEYKVPSNNYARQDKPVDSTYGVVNFNRNQSVTMPAQVPSGYAFLNYPEDKGSDQTRPVNSIYGVVQAPTGQPSHNTSSQTTSGESKQADVSVQRPPISPRKRTVNRSNSVPDSSYEFVELPTRINYLPRGHHSTPISIPSQQRSLPRAANYDTVVSPPLTRADPIGAPKSPYGNIDIAKSDEDRKEGDGLARGLPETRSDPEGAKKRDLQSPPARIAGQDYENVVLPPRTASMGSQKEMVYENMPVSPPTYEYNVPRPQPRPGVSSSTAERDRYKL